MYLFLASLFVYHWCSSNQWFKLCTHTHTVLNKVCAVLVSCPSFGQLCLSLSGCLCYWVLGGLYHTLAYYPAYVVCCACSWEDSWCGILHHPFLLWLLHSWRIKVFLSVDTRRMVFTMMISFICCLTFSFVLHGILTNGSEIHSFWLFGYHASCGETMGCVVICDQQGWWLWMAHFFQSDSYEDNFSGIIEKGSWFCLLCWCHNMFDNSGESRDSAIVVFFIIFWNLSFRTMGLRFPNGHQEEEEEFLWALVPDILHW